LDGTIKNSQITYRIKSIWPSFFVSSDEESNSFFIKDINDGSHEVGLFKKANVMLDRDNAQINSLIKLNIEAIDNGLLNRLSTIKLVKINLIDINDNFPVVLNKEALKNITVYENQELGKTIVQIQVTIVILF
jgi:hypothetical protein